MGRESTPPDQSESPIRAYLLDMIKFPTSMQLEGSEISVQAKQTGLAFSWLDAEHVITDQR